MLVIHLAYVFVCLCLCRTHFGQKSKESTNENFQVCLRTQVQSRILALQIAAYCTDAKETFASLSEKWVRKIKIIVAVKRYGLTRKCKNLQRFLKKSIF